MAEFTNESWYTAVVKDASYGMITKGTSNVPCASIVFQVSEGPCKDKTIRFEVTKWEPKNNIFTFAKLRTCGWQAKHPKTIREDLLGAAQAGKTVRIQTRWVDYNDNGFWSVDKIAPNNDVARPVAPATEDADAMMLEMMREAERANEEYKTSRSNLQAEERRRTWMEQETARPSTERVAAVGDPCRDCDQPLFKHHDGYLTCPNGHDTIPF